MNSKNKYAIGVDLGGTSIKLGIVSDNGKLVNKISVRTEAEKGPKKVIENIVSGINELTEKSKYKISRNWDRLPRCCYTRKRYS